MLVKGQGRHGRNSTVGHRKYRKGNGYHPREKRQTVAIGWVVRVAQEKPLGGAAWKHGATEG